MKTPFTWVSSARTDPGLARRVNEDAFLERHDIGLWVVADGMGGHKAGDVASQMLVDYLARVGPQARMSTFVDEVEAQVLAVNSRLFGMGHRKSAKSTIGCTVVALLACGSHCLSVWAGDSRVYLYRDGQLQALTRDHSQVEELVEQGLLLRVDAERHPEANIITRAVGATDRLYLDLELTELAHGDRYLLCSDGLYREVSEPEIAELLGAGTGAEASQALVKLTLERGAHDNVTVIVVDIEQVR